MDVKSNSGKRLNISKTNKELLLSDNLKAKLENEKTKQEIERSQFWHDLKYKWSLKKLGIVCILFLIIVFLITLCFYEFMTKTSIEICTQLEMLGNNGFWLIIGFVINKLFEEFKMDI